MRNFFLSCLLLSLFIPRAAGADEGISETDASYLKLIEAAAFQGFERMVDPATGLPVDVAAVAQGGLVQRPRDTVFSKTSPGHIALRLFQLVLSKERGYLTESETYDRAFLILDTLESMETYEGFLYNWYTLSEDPHRSLRVTLNRFVPFEQNGLLDASLMTLAGAYPGTPLARKAATLVEQRHYDFFLPKEGDRSLLKNGFDASSGKLSEENHLCLNDPGRVGVFIAVLKGDVPPAVWWAQERLVKPYKARSGEEIPVIISWTGGLSDFLLADEILGGDRIAPLAFGSNARNVLKIQRDWASRVSDTGLWGFSEGQVPEQNRYESAGIPPIAHQDDSADFVVPYATFLALRYTPAEALRNLKAIMRRYPACLGRTYGFCGSLDPVTGIVNRNIHAGDKGIEVLALGNYLSALEGKKQTADYLWAYFREKGWERKGMMLLKGEEKHAAFRQVRGVLTPAKTAAEPSPALDLLARTRDIGTFYDPDNAKASYDVDGRGDGRKTLRVRYDVRRRWTYSGVYMKFPDLNAGAFQALRFLIRGSEDKGFPKSVKVEIKYRGKSVQFERVPLTSSWHNVKVRLPQENKAFDEIVFVFENSVAGKHPRGEVLIQSLSVS
ncbi:MAG TPA: glucoamylase family protein [Verrucomicrobiae bacterium]|jgi:hypothetical protein|nr:glucoamylase family protein [Verrucomicrobiae bacterium]